MRKLNGATNPSEATPGTIRGDFGIETGRNVVHGSDSAASAAREIALHFGDSELVGYQRIDEAWLYE
jgi:nucleoside-diphosphate kinase